MQLEENDTPFLKTWITKRLEDISDADSDVLADYVLALVKSDEPDEQVRMVCLENLEDFLHDHAKTFVDDVLNAIRAKSFRPDYVPPKPKPSPLRASAAPFLPQSAAIPGLSSQANGTPSRKRTFHEREGSGSGDGNHINGFQAERDSKQMKRAARELYSRGRGRGRGRGSNFENQRDFRSSQNVHDLPAIPPVMPPMDPTQMMAAMQAMGFPSPVQFFGQGSPPPPHTFQPNDQSIRCRDYDTKGFCAAGNKCPYSHGDDYTIMPDHPSNEYDPKQSALTPTASTSPTTPQATFSSPPNIGRPANHGQNHQRGRGGRTAQQNGFGRQQRAVFSSSAPNLDRNITTIVVEQIPEEQFSEDAVREYFSEFGTIEDVNMQAYKRLAIVRYANYASARRAYDSPKVIFENRFVKVYWYKPDSLPKPPTNGAATTNRHPQPNKQQDQKEDTETLDPEEFAKRQEEAQKYHEQKLQKLKEQEAERAKLDQKIKEQDEARRKLIEKLAKKGAAHSPALDGTSAAPSPPSATNGALTITTSLASPRQTSQPSDSTVSKPTDSSKTAVLRAKLAELEAEAERLGLPVEDPSPPHHHPYSSYPPRGRGRGRGRPFYRGSPSRGRGGWPGVNGTGAVARLDNRPRTLEIKASKPKEEAGEVDFNDDKISEGLRAFLFNAGDYTSLIPSATSPNTVTISFRERYVAENFLSALSAHGNVIGGVGHCDVKWVANPPAPAPAPASNASVHGSSKGRDDVVGDMDAEHDEKDEAHGVSRHEDDRREVDYDVADDEEDHWMR